MELKPTYGNFQVTGTIYDFIKNKEGQKITEGKTSNGANYRSLRMSIQTSEYNIISVELFGMTKDKIRASKKVGTGKDTKYENKDFEWNKRYNLPKDYTLSGFETVTLTEDIEKQVKNNNVVLVSYDAIEKIAEIYSPGDAVFIRGGLGFNVYNNESRLRCSIQRILRVDESKFEKEGNEPCSKFEQTVVIRETRLEKENNKLIIDGLIITDKDGNFVEKEFYVNINEREKLAKNIKKLKPFTQIKLVGDIINEAIVSEEKETEDDGWGEDSVMQRKVIEGYVSALKVTMADPESIISEMYKEEDFIIKDDLDDEDEDLDDDDIFDNKDDEAMPTLENNSDDEDEWLE